MRFICLDAFMYLPHLCHLVPKRIQYPFSFSDGNSASLLQRSNFRLLLTATCWSLGNFIVGKKETTVGIAVGCCACFYLPDPPTLCLATVPKGELFSGTFYHSLFRKSFDLSCPKNIITCRTWMKVIEGRMW